MGGCRGPIKYGSVQEVDGGLRVHDLEDLAKQGAQLFRGNLPMEDKAEPSRQLPGHLTPQMQNEHLETGPTVSHCPPGPQGCQPTPRRLSGPAGASPLSLLLHCSPTHSHLSTRASLRKRAESGQHPSQGIWTAFPTLHNPSHMCCQHGSHLGRLFPRDRGQHLEELPVGTSQGDGPRRTTQVEGRQ